MKKYMGGGWVPYDDGWMHEWRSAREWDRLHYVDGWMKKWKGGRTVDNEDGWMKKGKEEVGPPNAHGWTYGWGTGAQRMRKERHRPALAWRYSFTSAGSFPLSLQRSIYITRCVCAFLAFLLSTRSFLFCISATLLLPSSYNNSILHNYLLPVKQQQPFVW
jgi:hypothetical protein